MSGEPVTALGIATAVGWTLLHSLWQAAIMWLAVGAFRRRVSDPALRSRAADLGLLLFLLVQGLTLIACLAHVAGTLPVWNNAAAPIELTPLGTIKRPPPLVGGWAGDLVVWLDPCMPWLVGLWWALSLARLMRFARGAQLAGRALSIAPSLPDGLLSSCQRIAADLGVTRPVRFVAAALTEGPGTIGWLRPYVFIPPAVILSMPAAQLEAIVTHELAHVMRRDYLSASLRLIVESIYAANPIVAWVIAAAANDAEMSCDAIATTRMRAPVEYARALATLAEHVIASRATLNATGGSLKDRVSVILAPPMPSRSRTIWGRAIGASMAAAALLSLASAAIADASAHERELRWLESRSLGEAVRPVLQEVAQALSADRATAPSDAAAKLASLSRWAADDRNMNSTLSLRRALIDPAIYASLKISPAQRERLIRAVAFDGERDRDLFRLALSERRWAGADLSLLVRRLSVAPVAQLEIARRLPRDDAHPLRQSLIDAARADASGRLALFLTAATQPAVRVEVIAAGVNWPTTRPRIIRRDPR